MTDIIIYTNTCNEIYFTKRLTTFTFQSVSLENSMLMNHTSQTDNIRSRFSPAYFCVLSTILSHYIPEMAQTILADHDHVQESDNKNILLFSSSKIQHKTTSEEISSGGTICSYIYSITDN